MDVIRVADLWEENQEFLKQKLGQSESTHLDARWVLMAQVPFPKFNHVSMIRIPPEGVDELIAACRSFFRHKGLPNCSMLVTPATRPVDLGNRLHRLGFTSETNPVMVWDGKTRMPQPTHIRVEITPPSQAGKFFEVIRQVFFPDTTSETAQGLRRGVDVSYGIGALNYIAYWGALPCGAGTLFCRNGMGGIYNMATLPTYRHKGVATAVMNACLDDALRLGCTHVGLTPTKMGRPLYERMGFQEVYQERYYVERFYS